MELKVGNIQLQFPIKANVDGFVPDQCIKI